MTALPESITDGASGHDPHHEALHALYNKTQAKGDLVVGTGPQAWARVPVGAPGTVWTADPTTPTGTKWAQLAGDFSIERQGAVGNSSRVGGGTDSTVAIRDAITFAQLTGGVVTAGPGFFRITDEVHFAPNGDIGVDLWCSGSSTVFILDGPNAKITLSNGGPSTVAGQRGSQTGNFRYFGINGCTQGVVLGLFDQRQFPNMWGEVPGGTALTLEGTQNCTFPNLTIFRSDVGVRFDYGASGNYFPNPEVGFCRIRWEFTSTSVDPGVTNNAGVPSLNQIFAGHSEYADSDTECHVHYGAGSDNHIWGHAFATSRTGAGEHTPCVRVRKDNPAGVGVSGLYLHHCRYEGSEDGSSVPHGYGVDVDVAGYTGPLVYVDGGQFLTLDCMWNVRDGNQVIVLGEPTFTNITQPFRNHGGAGTVEAGVQEVPRRHFSPRIMPGALNLVERIVLEGEEGTGFRWMQLADGSMIWCDGTDFVGQTKLHQDIPARLTCDQSFLALGGLITKAKNGAITDADMPAGTPRDGAMILDVSGSRLGVRVGGTWKYTALT